MLKSNAGVPALIGAVLLIAVLIGVVVWRTGKSAGSASDQIIVKPANPDDPKFKPNPKLGLAGGGGGS